MSKLKDSKSIQVKRPLSPHLTIYKPQITSVMSILHRATGVFLIGGALVLSLWVIALSGGLSFYDCVVEFLNSLLGNILLFGWAFSLFYHMLNGIRHLFWDIGCGFDLKSVYASGWTVIVVSLFLTVITWHTAMEQVEGAL